MTYARRANEDWNVARRLQPSENRPSSIFNANGLQLTLIKVGRIDVEREDVAGMRGSRDAPVLGDRIHSLAVDFEEHRAAFDAAVERRAHRLDTGDQDTGHLFRQFQTLRGLPIEIADDDSE